MTVDQAGVSPSETVDAVFVRLGVSNVAKVGEPKAHIKRKSFMA
ncbi:hypothetical protein [Methylobacterium sp. BTF04]|nr:hypothetical protein [Methylobacterium sp. BTF04]